MVIFERNVGGPLLAALRLSFVDPPPGQILATLHTMAAVGLGVVTVATAATLALGTTAPQIVAIWLVVGLACTAICGGAAWALRHNHRSQVTASLVASILVLPLFFLGTIAGIYGLVLLQRFRRESLP